MTLKDDKESFLRTLSKGESVNGEMAADTRNSLTQEQETEKELPAGQPWPGVCKSFVLLTHETDACLEYARHVS